MIQKFHPTSANHSKMAYEIYRNRNSTDEDFKLISEMYERVMREDKVLCNNAQKNLDRNVFINGQLHPKYEKAPLFFQSAVRDAITKHFELEKSEDREIWPAKRKLPFNAQASEKDEEICAAVSCGTNKDSLAW
jgi:peptide subunit release factor RF-3